MRQILILFSCIGLAFLIAAAGAATQSSSSSASTSTSSVSASTTLSSQDQASLVTLSQVTLDPQVFYPGETGTITLTLTNSGSASVGLSNANLLDPNFQIKNPTTYQGVSYIGPGTNLTFTFLVTAPNMDGTYFPIFSAGPLNAQSITYPITVKVDSTPVDIGILDQPDNFAINSPSTVNISVVNSRAGDITNLLIVPEGSGFTVDPARSFTSAVGAGSSDIESFTITPTEATNVTFHVTYNNGQNNPHSQDITLPLNIGEAKTGAAPVINNVALAVSGSYYTLTGDVTNTGVSDAVGMVVSVVPPANAVEPYTNYAVGALASDDFSSFTVTFTASDLSSVPVQVEWKDSKGDTFTTITNLDLRALAADAYAGSRNGGSGSSGSLSSAGGAAAGGGGGNFRGGGGGGFIFGGGRGGGLSSFYPIIAAAIVVIAGIVLYTKRKWIISKLKKQ